MEKKNFGGHTERIIQWVVLHLMKQLQDYGWQFMENENPSFNIGDFIHIPVPKESKFQHEFQELCTELEPIYGKVIWSLPFRAGFSEYKIREAHRIASLRGNTSVGYLIGIIKRLP